jgi:hypothetical protein
MDAFMQNFYTVFDFLSDHKLYLVGESYAGIYIPAIAHGFYIRNDEQANYPEIPTTRKHVNIAGIAIGNGKIDAMSQDPAVIDYFYWHGLIDGATRKVLHDEWDFCMTKTHMSDGDIGTSAKTQAAHIKKNSKDYKGTDLFHPYQLRDDCGIFGAAWAAAGNEAFTEMFETGPNIYEYSTWDPYEAGEGDTGTIGALFNNPDVQRALHIAEDRIGYHWQGCIPESEQADDRRRLHKILSGEADDSSSFFSDVVAPQEDRSHRRLFMDYDTPWSVLDYVATLLDDAKIDVMMYSGDRDIICCTQGTEAALQKMKWSGNEKNDWAYSKRSLWIYNGTYPAGYVKEHKNLQMVTIYNAGHMAPYNQPGPSLDLFERFLKKQSFHDKPLPNIPSQSTHSHKPSKHSDTLLLEASLTGKSSPSIQRSETMHAVSGGVLLTVGAAFLIGFVAARYSPSGNGRRVQTREYALGDTSSYGAISGTYQDS